MSVIRVGSTQKFADGWEAAFGKATGQKKTAAKKKAAPAKKKAAAKKSKKK
ncbi:MAG: hypothetical protein KDA61_18340 [Planctomycetales bacterium]|nr:hypothetical protein [Planctomycetales bacterium]